MIPPLSVHGTGSFVGMEKEFNCEKAKRGIKEKRGNIREEENVEDEPSLKSWK